MFKFKLPVIKLHTLYIVHKETNCTYVVHFIFAKRAKRYFEIANKSNEYEVSMETSVLQIW